MKTFKTYLCTLWGCLLCSVYGYGQTQPTPDSTAALDIESLMINAAKQRFIGNPDKAASIYEQILSNQPDHAASTYELARIALAKSDLDRALKYAESASKKEPLNIWYQQLLAEIHVEMGHFAQAAQVYEALTQSFPLEAANYLKWAELLEKGALYPAALKAYEAAEARFGVQQKFLTARAALYLKIGDVKKAGRELERLCEAFPNNTSFLHQLASFYAQQKDAAQATAVYRRILSIDSQDPRALAALAGTGTPGTNPLSDLDALIQNQRVEPGLKVDKIQPLLNDAAKTRDSVLLGQLLKHIQTLNQVHPGVASVNILLAQAFQLNHQDEAALQHFLYALKLDETQYDVWEQTLRLLVNQGNGPELFQQASTALDIFPNKPKLYYYHALAVYWQGNTQAALIDLDQALVMGGNETSQLVEIQSIQGLLLSTLEQTDAASRAFSAASTIQKDAPILLARRALALLSKNQEVEQAAILGQQALRGNPGLMEAVQAMAWLAFRQKNWIEAQRLLKTLPYTNHPQLLELLGDIAFKSGLPEEAVAYWNQAKAKGGKNTRLLKKISDKQLYE